MIELRGVDGFDLKFPDANVAFVLDEKDKGKQTFEQALVQKTRPRNQGLCDVGYNAGDSLGLIEAKDYRDDPPKDPPTPTSKKTVDHVLGIPGKIAGTKVVLQKLADEDQAPNCAALAKPDSDKLIFHYMLAMPDDEDKITLYRQAVATAIETELFAVVDQVKTLFVRKGKVSRTPHFEASQAS